MVPRIKLLSHYVGSLPPYALDFVKRVREISIVDWELLWFGDVEQVNRRVSEKLGVKCCKKDGFCLSDVRPTWAEVFSSTINGYEWWGWCEIDVVLGDLDRLLPPLLDEYDILSMFSDTVSGPLMLFRNTPECNGLFRRGNWMEVLAEPSYCNYEEVSGAHIAGFHKSEGMTRIVKDSGLRIWWNNNFSTWEGFPAGDTPYGCLLDGKRLIETPSGVELYLHHFNHTKEWPSEY